jgi:membrane-associated protease RseP (regulator of RpoE activity)
VPKKNFDDFLGKGFSGDIEGKRAKISELKMADFKFSTPIVAFPDSSSLKHVKMVENRVGSIGAEIFRRFRVVFDYERGKMYLKKNANFKSHFKYNKSGIEIEQNGLKWVEDYVKLENSILKSDGVSDQEFGKLINNYKYKFELKPNYVIANIRKKSAAEKCGLKVGDEIVSIGGVPVFRYSLQKINNLFMVEDDKNITIVVLRDNNKLKFTFRLESEL